MFKDMKWIEEKQALYRRNQELVEKVRARAAGSAGWGRAQALRDGGGGLRALRDGGGRGPRAQGVQGANPVLRESRRPWSLHWARWASALLSPVPRGRREFQPGRGPSRPLPAGARGPTRGTRR